MHDFRQLALLKVAKVYFNLISRCCFGSEKISFTQHHSNISQTDSSTLMMWVSFTPHIKKLFQPLSNRWDLRSFTWHIWHSQPGQDDDTLLVPPIGSFLAALNVMIRVGNVLPFLSHSAFSTVLYWIGHSVLCNVMLRSLLGQVWLSVGFGVQAHSASGKPKDTINQPELTEIMIHSVTFLTEMSVPVHKPSIADWDSYEKLIDPDWTKHWS